MADQRSLRGVWDAMPRWQRAGTVTLGIVEIIATTAAAVDLVRRPRDQVRGPKALWWPTLTIQPVGPFAYLALGRRKS